MNDELLAHERLAHEGLRAGDFDLFKKIVRTPYIDVTNVRRLKYKGHSWAWMAVIEGSRAGKNSFRVAALEDCLALGATLSKPEDLKHPEAQMVHYIWLGSLQETLGLLDIFLANKVEWNRPHMVNGKLQHPIFMYALRSMLGKASKATTVNALERIVAAGADVDGRNYRKQTSLMWRAFRPHDFYRHSALEIIEMILNLGADINAEDQYGLRAIDWAELYPATFPNEGKHLKTKEPVPNHPLRRKKEKIVRFLLDRGSQPGRDLKGKLVKALAPYNYTEKA